MRQSSDREVAGQTCQTQTDAGRQDGLQPRIHQSGQYVHDAMRLLPEPESRGDSKRADQQIEQAARSKSQPCYDSKGRLPNSRSFREAILYHADKNPAAER